METERRLISKPHQRARLYKYMTENGGITTMQAIMDLGIINPAARVMELKSKGINVKTTIKHGINRYGQPCHFAYYSIVGGAE